MTGELVQKRLARYEGEKLYETILLGLKNAESVNLDCAKTFKVWWNTARYVSQTLLLIALSQLFFRGSPQGESPANAKSLSLLEVAEEASNEVCAIATQSQPYAAAPSTSYSQPTIPDNSIGTSQISFSYNSGMPCYLPEDFDFLCHLGPDMQNYLAYNSTTFHDSWLPVADNELPDFF
jgi:hypothetical protein